MLKKFVVPLSIVFVGSGVIATLVLAKPKPATQPAPEAPAHMSVDATQVQAQTARLTVRTQGTVEPKRQINVVAQVSGMITHVSPKFDGGGFFSANEILLNIDPRDYQAALAQANARLADAKRALAEEQGLSRQAKREWRDLGNQAANDLFVRKPQLAAAKASVTAAEADAATAQLNLERTQITLPFNGRIKNTMANVGQYIVAGTPLAEVYDSQVVEVHVPLNEQQAALINLPISAEAFESQVVNIEASIAGTPHQWQGQLKRTDAFINTTTRMISAVIEVQDPFTVAVPLLPGAFVEVSMPSKTLTDVWHLPKRALYQRNKLVFISADNKTDVVEVAVLHKSDSNIWVQASTVEPVLVSLEKQAFTPTGTQVIPTDQATVAAAQGEQIPSPQGESTQGE